MSLKAELEIWAGALKAYDEEDFDKSLDLFSVRTLSLIRLAYLTIALADSRVFKDPYQHGPDIRYSWRT